jgi:hypothetical protein
LFWILAVVGGAVMAFGVCGLFRDAARAHPDQWVRWFVGAALVHDFLVAPLVFVVAALTRRLLSERSRGIVNGALIATAVLSAMTYPFLRGFGDNPDNASILPNNYALNLSLVVGLLWLVVAVTLIARSRVKPGRDERQT